MSLFGNNNPFANKGMFVGSKTFEQRFNDQTYQIQLFLDNSGNFDGAESNRYYINPAAVINLSIDDLVNNWVAEGSLTMMYLPDDVSPKSNESTGQTITSYILGAKDNADLLKSYQFRGDGFDLLRVIVVPISKTNDNNTAESTVEVDSSDPKWTLSYLFSITEVEDVDEVPGNQGPLASYMKCVKLSFRDVRYQILKTTNLEYSTTQSLEANFNSGLSNEGVLKTGAAILEVFNQAVGDPETGGALEFKQTKGPDWDEGSSEMFYTSPAQWSAAEDIDYLFNHHTSVNGISDSSDTKDLCLMHTKRPNVSTELEPVCITPLSKFFEEACEGSTAGPAQLEHFFVTSHTSFKDEITKEYKAPFSDAKDRDLKTFKYGQIISYSFVDMSPEINTQMFISSPVYSVDIGKRIFSIKFENNDVKTARKLIADAYISKLYNKGSDPEKLFLPTIHKSKEKLNLFPTFSLNGEQNPLAEIVRQKNGISQLLYTGLFQNACICFSTFGLTLRESGSIIAIDRDSGGAPDNDYNNKLYGQWFVVRVIHGFEAGAYMNVIYAVKLHRFKEMKNSISSTI